MKKTKRNLFDVRVEAQTSSSLLLPIKRKDFRRSCNDPDEKFLCEVIIDCWERKIFVDWSRNMSHSEAARERSEQEAFFTIHSSIYFHLQTASYSPFVWLCTIHVRFVELLWLSSSAPHRQGFIWRATKEPFLVLRFVTNVSGFRMKNLPAIWLDEARKNLRNGWKHHTWSEENDDGLGFGRRARRTRWSNCSAANLLVRSLYGALSLRLIASSTHWDNNGAR